eukprot:SM000028S10072  [mRNA]  locus=s28:192167:196359:+ [translate_table: standard]
MELLKPLYTSWATPVLLFAIAYACVYLPHREKGLQEACSLYDYEHYVLYSRRVVTPKGIQPAAIEVLHGRIASVIKRQEAPVTSEKLPVVDYGSLVISPGLVDIHVHLNEPGRTEWEGFVSGTRAAAAGGITTLVDMPLNSIPTTINKEALLLKLAAAEGKLAVDVGFWGGLVTENALEPAVLDDLLKEGALGLKSFMCPSGINDFPDTNATHFEVALPILAKYGRPLLVHGELVLPIVNSDHEQQEEDPQNYSTYLRSRPPSWQALQFYSEAWMLEALLMLPTDLCFLLEAAVRHLMQVANETAPGGYAVGARVHLAHLSDPNCLPLIEEAKVAGADVTVETCPHYLTFSAEEIQRGDTRFKCAPPIRPAAMRELLWEGLLNGQIDLLSSDHSPAPPELKLLEEGNFLRAWGGISGLQFGLSATWTAGSTRGVTFQQLADWWSSRPADVANLHQKGHIENGRDADFVVWDPDASFTLNESFPIFHKHKV